MPGLAEALARAGVTLPVRPMGARSMYFGGVGVVVRDPSGDLVAAGDPRREGAVAVALTRPGPGALSAASLR